MNRRRLFYAIVAIGVLLNAAWLLLLTPQGGGRNNDFQCGHWAVYRCCQLLGAPVDKTDIVNLLPIGKREHSLLELSQALAKIGFDTEGRRETWESLCGDSLPYIAHLEAPEHFVVVSAVSRNGDEVYLFDGAGRRTTRSGKVFRKAWSGVVLCVRRKQDAEPLPAFTKDQHKSGPRIQFDTLFVDKGEVPLVGEPTAFMYPFRNLGTEDLTVKDVITTCKCLKHEAPTSPIPPGGKGVVTLFYHPTAKQRLFNYTAVVETNDPLFPDIILNAVGNAGAEVSVAPTRLDLDEVSQGESISSVCFVGYSGDREHFAVERATCTAAGVELTIHRGTDLQRFRRWWPDGVTAEDTPPNMQAVELTFTPPSNVTGDIEGLLHIHTNVKEYADISVPVKASIVPRIRTCPSVLHFGVVLPDTRYQVALTLSAFDDEPIRVLAVESESHDLKAESSQSPSISPQVRFAALGSTALKLSGSKVSVQIERRATGQRATLEVPVLAWASQCEEVPRN